MPSTDLGATRKALHAVAELVLAGPQYRRSGTIRLRITPGGFGTVTAPDLRVDGIDLVSGTTRVSLKATTPGAVAAAAGVDAGIAAGVYHDGGGAGPDDQIDVDADAAARIAAAYALGVTALQRLDATQTAVLWPEHFDVSITVDEIDFGVSPGDSWLDEPYAYVSLGHAGTGPFWTAPFGAARPMRDIPDADALASFFATGRELA